MGVPGTSWGGYPHAKQQLVPLHWRNTPLPAATGTLLAHGNGRSYGDSCLNDGGTLLHTRGLDRFIAYDAETGIFRCEAGALFSEILDFVVPRGWFLPVVPGTALITVGGAIANDVHGKNHHRAGTFGEHVRCLELLRSDGSRLVCSREVNAELFAATIGGLGLTGVITWAEFALKSIPGTEMSTETLRFGSLAEFFALSAQSGADHEYSVAWVDCGGSGSTFGRGLLIRANHAAGHRRAPRPLRLRMPFTPPFSVLNRASLRVLNAAYFHGAREGTSVTYFERYFFPLDAIADWNRIYGPRGFLQYQCVVPPPSAHAAIGELLHRISASGGGSFLAVLKVFSDRPAAGILSFTRAGTTLALDFPYRGAETFALFEQLDDIVVSAGGAVYPAKDARMRGARFRRYFPQWQTILPHIDPRFSSGFWRRVMQT